MSIWSMSAASEDEDQVKVPSNYFISVYSMRGVSYCLIVNIKQGVAQLQGSKLIKLTTHRIPLLIIKIMPLELGLGSPRLVLMLLRRKEETRNVLINSESKSLDCLQSERQKPRFGGSINS